MAERNFLYKQLKKINPATTQQWPRVSIASLRNEIKKVLAEEAKTMFESKSKIQTFLTTPIHEASIITTADEFLPNLKYLNIIQNFIIEMKYNVNGEDTYRIIKNYDSIKNILNLIKQGYDEKTIETYGSDVETFYEFIKYGGDIELTWFDKNLYSKTNGGAYFKYFHLIKDLDLTRYQIYTKYQKINYEPCLYYAFSQAKVDDDTLDNLKFLIQEKHVLMRDLKNVSKSIGYNIEVTSTKSDNRAIVTNYNNNFENTIKLGLVDNHYFINEETNFTVEVITNKRDSRKRKLSSYTLIRKLYEFREKVLIPITIENINNHSHKIEFESNYKLRDLKIECKCKGEKKCNNYFNGVNICKYAEVQPYWERHSKFIFKGNFHILNDPNIGYRLCFVDLETFACDEDETNYYKDSDVLIQTHYPYCLSYSYSDEDTINHFYGENCVLNFLDSLKTDTVIITHNLAFDFRGFINHLHKLKTPIETGSKLKSIQCKYKNFHLAFKDNCAFLPFRLSSLPSMFNLQSGDKDVYPYTLINKNNHSDLIKLDIVLSHIKENKNDFIENCKKVNCLYENNLVDIKKYTIHYCNQDVNILKQSYLTFRSQILEITKLDILKLISLPQLADEYFKSKGVYNGCFKINGVAQDFIRKACHGGRVMCADNQKYHITNKKISDFDAVSLYPSAMHRLPGYLKGVPKLIKVETNWRGQDYYFVEIEITKIKLSRAFPLVSLKDENGIKNYTNDIIGQKIIVDKTTLEDLIEFHGIVFKFIRGYYFDEGFNSKIKEVIEFMFNERIKLKKEGNPLQNAYKLILNASYGKLIQKPIKKTKTFYEGKDYRNYIIRNCESIIDYYRINEKVICVNKSKSIINHYTGCHMASQVLSMSKRIMNEVMCLAEDNNLQIYYQDTDSMHIEAQHIQILSDKYKNKYQRELIGSKMGQFHSDFEVKSADKDYEINAIESIFLGKKAYVDKLEYKQNGEIKYDYHIRMKGMPSKIIKEFNEDIMKTYMNLYNNEKITLDMAKCCPLELTKTYRAINRIEFKRTLCFA